MARPRTSAVLRSTAHFQMTETRNAPQHLPLTHVQTQASDTTHGNAVPYGCCIARRRLRRNQRMLEIHRSACRSLLIWQELEQATFTLRASGAFLGRHLNAYRSTICESML